MLTMNQVGALVNSTQLLFIFGFVFCMGQMIMSHIFRMKSLATNSPYSKNYYELRRQLTIGLGILLLFFLTALMLLNFLQSWNAITFDMPIHSHPNWRREVTSQVTNAMQLLVIFCFVCGVTKFVISILKTSKKATLHVERLLNDASKKYTQDLEEAYTTMRSIKHDYANIMASFKLYIDSGDMAGLEKYYYNELSEINQNLLHQDKLIKYLQNIKINEIKSILLYKASVAAEYRIDTEIEARNPVENLSVSTAIVCQILGILLDNAIEATQDAAMPKLHIAIFNNKNAKTFVIQNTWMKQNIAMDKLFKLGFSTKGEGRGAGLHTVNNYTNKFENLYIETELDDEYFTQILTIKDVGKC